MCILAALWIVTQRELHAAASPVRDVLADYDAELRRPDGRVDVDAMAARLKELGVTSYYWLIWHAATDWDDLKLFLPKAAQAGIAVTVYLVPPSESPPQYGSQYSEPFRLDYGTGFSVYVLRLAGRISKDDPRIRRAVTWLQTHQRASGYWYTRSPRNSNELSTYVGTAYAILALKACGGESRDQQPREYAGWFPSLADRHGQPVARLIPCHCGGRSGHDGGDTHRS